MEINPGWVTAGIAVLTLIGTLCLQWVRYERRLTEVKAEAENSLHVAADAEQEAKAAHQKSDALRQDSVEARDRLRRDFGETVSAMQHKIHELETWSRDEFVRKKSFEDVIGRIEKGMEQRDERLDKRLERMESKLDDAASIAAKAAVDAIAMKINQ